MKKSVISFLIAVPLLFSIIFCKADVRHYGGPKMMEADIEFFNPRGTFIADGTGIYYKIDGKLYHRNTFYPEQYWGEYPLYFPATTVPVAVGITNKNPQAVTGKHALITESCVLNTDGSYGETVTPTQIIESEVAVGETKRIDASFALPAVGKNMHIFFVRLYQRSNDNNYASLVISKEAVFCAPEYVDFLDSDDFDEMEGN